MRAAMNRREGQERPDTVERTPDQAAPGRRARAGVDPDGPRGTSRGDGRAGAISTRRTPGVKRGVWGARRGGPTSSPSGRRGSRPAHGRAGVELLKLSEFLGHSDPRTTRRYRKLGAAAFIDVVKP